MKNRFIIPFLLFIAMVIWCHPALSQIGTKIQEQTSIYGTWQNIDFGTNLVLILEPDGSGQFDGKTLKFHFDSSKLILIQNYNRVIYSYRLMPNSLQLSEGDIKGTITFERSAGVKNTVYTDSIIAHDIVDSDQILTEVKIGNQIWCAQNLNVNTFRNGDPIPEAKSWDEWRHADDNGKPYWCYYNNDPQNEKKYGKLYNWWAVNDVRGLAPSGWHIASNSEWLQLIDYLGGEKIAGGKMKNGIKWLNVYGNGFNLKGSNESGFSAVPGGFAGEYGNSFSLGYSGNWWPGNSNWLFILDNNSDSIDHKKGALKRIGLSVRCVKN